MCKVSADGQGSHLTAFYTKFVEVQVKMQKAEQQHLRQNLRLGWHVTDYLLLAHGQETNISTTGKLLKTVQK